MELYKLSFQDTFLGTLTVNTDTGMYAFEPDFAGVDAVKEKTVLIVEIERGTKGFVPPIPFFQNRILHFINIGHNVENKTRKLPGSLHG